MFRRRKRARVLLRRSQGQTRAKRRGQWRLFHNQLRRMDKDGVVIGGPRFMEFHNWF